jgi:peptidoglycan/LPS O-acetylase OafA/YrhL
MVEGVPGGSGGTRLKSLDALRGIAACAVVLFHYTSGFDQRHYFPGYPQALFSFAVGRYGVALFFVISGFVILWSIQRVNTVGDFAYSRFSRLFPPYWASLFFGSAYILFAEHVLNAGIAPLTFTGGQWFANLTMVPRWIPPFRFLEVDGVYWTLAIEMGFYLLIGVMMATGLTKRNRIVPAMFSFWCFDLVLNVLRFLSGVSSGNHAPGTGDYTNLFMAGMALFLLFQERDRPRRDRQILWVMVWGAPVLEALRFQKAGTVVVLVIVATVYFAIFRSIPLLHTRPLQWVGGISYSLYLVHAYPGYITIKLLLDHGWNRNLAVVAAIVQTFILAIILNKTVEKPVTRWLRQRRSSIKPVPEIATT